MQLILGTKTENLVDTLAGIISSKSQTQGCLSKDWIIIENSDIEQYLYRALAKKLGIIANTDFITIGQAIRRMDEKVLTQTSNILSNTQSFFATAAEWKLSNPLFSDQQIARDTMTINKLWEEYRKERPDLISDWELGGLKATHNQPWQAKLWKKVKDKYPNHHSVPKRGKLRKSLKDLKENLDLPSRLIIFLPNNIPPSVREALDFYNEFVEIWWLCVSPSQEYWFYDSFQSDSTSSPILSELSYINGLNLGYLYSHASEIVELFDSFESKNDDDALNLIKKNISIGGIFDNIEPDDTIRFVNAPDPIREIEELKNWLISRFNQNPTISLSEVAIATPDPGLYGPIIQGIFDHSDHEISIPTARDKKNDATVADILLLFILDVLEYGFRPSELISVLLYTPVKKSLRLDNQDIEKINEWCHDAGLKRSIDGHKHSVVDARKRILEGFLADPIAKNATGATQTEPMNQSKRISVLLSIMNMLIFINDLPRNLKPNEWIDQFEKAMSFLPIDPAINLTKWQNHLSEIEQFNCSLPVIGLWIRDRQKFSGKRPVSFDQNISVNSLKSLDGIPFQLIALVGIDENTISCKANEDPQNLVLFEPRPGDPDPKGLSKQYFFNLLWNTRNAIWLSWVGTDPSTFNKIYPAEPIQIILNTISSTIPQHKWITEIPQPKQTNARSIKAKKTSLPQSSNLVKECITLNDLVFFSYDPTKHFLKSCGMSSTNKILRSPDLEPLDLDGIEKYQFLNEIKKMTLLSGISYNKDIESKLINHPLIPQEFTQSTIGSIFHSSLKSAIKKQSNSEFLNYKLVNTSPLPIVLKRQFPTSVPRVVFTKNAQNYRLLGCLLEIVALSTRLQNPIEIEVVGIDNAIWVTQTLEPDMALEILSRWSQAFLDNMTKPIPLITPLALNHKEKLLRGISVSIDWTSTQLTYYPHVIRVLEEIPNLNDVYTKTLVDLIIPLPELLPKLR